MLRIYERTSYDSTDKSPMNRRMKSEESTDESLTSPRTTTSDFCAHPTKHTYKMTTSSSDKFFLLLWKNWIIQKRHYIQTIFEIIIPVLACSLLILIRGLVDPEEYPDPIKFKPLPIDTVDHLRLNKDIDPPIIFSLAYSPPNVILDKLVNEVSVKLGLDAPSAVFENGKKLQDHLVNYNLLAGIEFNDEWKNITQLPDDFVYKLRFPGEMRSLNEQGSEFWAIWRTDLMFPVFQIAGARNRERDDGGYPANYWNESFIAIQSALSRAYISGKDETAEIPEIFLNRYPYPPYYSDPLLTGLENLLPLIILIAFFYTAINTVKYITVEKEKQLKEAMKIMGLPSWIHWSAWFVKSILLLMISISLITILLCVSITTNSDLAIFTYADPSVVWFYLFVYSVSTICFCFMLSVFFSKANTAAGISGLAWFIFTMPYNIAFQSYGIMSTGSKLGLCLFSNSAMSFGFMLMMRHEGTSNGLQWSNLFKPVTVDDNFHVGHTMIMLLVDALIYLLIALYVERVMPGEFGIAEPWYFLFTKKFWSNKVDYVHEEEVYQNQNVENIETDPKGKIAGIQIRGLRKVFDKTKVAVTGLNLNMYEDQITVLLGHNGAGKTTTMSMLTGMFSPTSGTAKINGSDIRANIAGVRSSLGLCPQHNVLFNEMTVAEHITFFCRLKGVKKDDVKKEIKKYVDLLELQDKENAQSHTLSGGMKRKLSIGVALCGNSKVVLCDEPTSGMDPSARRLLWDLLQKEKAGRTILLSTHFMDEADILGDRIAIMADGDLKACGSSFFLKKKFGVGYRLICVKAPNCNPDHLTNILRKFIPNIQVETDIGSELSYILNEDYTGIFKDLLKDLEENSNACGITGYGISLTTLEEVFLKVGSDSSALDVKPHYNETNGYSQDENRSSSESSLAFDETGELLHGTNLNMNQIWAMILKKFISTKRSWAQLFVQNFIPVFFIAMTIIIVNTFPESSDLSALKIELDSYAKTTTVLEVGVESEITKQYKNIFESTPASQRLKVITEKIEDYILDVSNENIGMVNNEYLVGATVSATNHTIWFNAQGYHTAPLTLNLMYNAILATVCEKCSIAVINAPLPYRPETRFNLLQAGNNMGFQLSFNTGFAMAFVSAIFIMFYIKERTSRAKLLQFVSGVNVFTFWIVSFVWDYFSFIATILLYTVFLAIFQEDGWSTATQLGRVFLVLMVFGFSALPFTYLFSYFFDVPASGFVKMMIFNIFTGTIFFTTVFLLEFDGFDLQDVARGLTWAFLLFPHFALSHSLSNINVAITTQTVCEQQCATIPICLNDEFMCKVFSKCCNTDIFTFKPHGINRDLMYMTIVGVFSFLLILFVEYRVIERIFKKRYLYFGPPPPETEDMFLDSDVKAEKERINDLDMSKIESTNLVIRSMTKFYKKFLAVNQLSLAVGHTECFGLLGVNGAGKTSTFKMLTGDENISSGEAWVQGISLNKNMNRVHKEIGYCPQFDALLEDLTGRETLKIFALLRGIPNDRIFSVSMKLAEDLNFMKHIDKKIKEYSGGNKRKLSTALALIGNPSVIYLDEPTTGMDPGAKRQLWNMLCKVRNAGKSIVLTSHSMEECEALCTRLAIMVNGEFKCIGSTQHLKNKFSKGFFLTIKLKKSEDPYHVTAVKEYINQYFTGAYLKEEYQDSLAYHITQSELKWSTMFGLMEEAKERLEIEDYSLGQTSLEQVFLFFTKYQRVTE